MIEKRTMKFRGKRISDGQWVYGDLITNNGRPYIVNEVIEATEEHIILGDWTPVHFMSVEVEITCPINTEEK